MTLRSRLFLSFGGLIALLVGAEWWLVSALTGDLEQEIDQVAFEVGSSVMGIFGQELADDGRYVTRRVSAQQHGVRVRAFAFDFDAPTLQLGELAPLGEVERADRAFDVERFGWRREPPIVRFGGASVRLEQARDIARDVWFSDDERAREDKQLFVHKRHLAFTIITSGDRGQVDLEREHTERDQGAWGGNGDEGWTVLMPGWSAPAPLGREVRGLVSVELAEGVPGGADDGAPGIVSAGAAPPAERSQRHTARVPIPREGLDAATDSFLSRLLLGSGAILGLGLLIAGYAAHRVSHPLRGLAHAAREVEAGALGTQAPEGGDIEVAETIAAFNAMSLRLEDLAGEAEGLRRREHLTELGEVARGLAHTLRNPLNVLGLTIEELAGHGDARLVAAARAQIQRIDRSLRVFLSLSSGGGALERVALDDVVRDVALELLQDTTRESAVEVHADEAVEVLAVGPELRALVHVIMVNAVEAGPPGAPVVVRVEALGDGARVEVLDEGAGLAPEVRARLFTPHTTTKENGAGMGLYLAQRIVTTRYDGSLTLEDREPRGTRAVLVVRGRSLEAREDEGA